MGCGVAMVVISPAFTAVAVAVVAAVYLLLPWEDADSPWLAGDAFDQLSAQRSQRAMGLWLASLRPDERPPPWPEIVIWAPPRSPGTVGAPRGLPLVLLAAWRLQESWEVPVSLASCLEPREAEEEEQATEDPHQARSYLRELAGEARIPDADLRVCRGRLAEQLAASPEALHLVVLERPVRPGGLQELQRACPGGLVIATLSGQARTD